MDEWRGLEWDDQVGRGIGWGARERIREKTAKMKGHLGDRMEI